jgi:hypothetical protein
MSRLSLQLRVTKALSSAGASEEILSLVNLCFEQCLTPQDTGRPRQYANRNEQQRAYRERKRREKALADLDREDRRLAREGLEGASRLLVDAEPLAFPAQTRVASLKGRLVDAARWNVDREADVEPIRALIEQGCDLEADVLPVVARNVPDLTHPLRNWGVRWLVQDIVVCYLHTHRIC